MFHSPEENLADIVQSASLAAERTGFSQIKRTRVHQDKPHDHDSVDRFCSSLAPYFVLWVGLFFPLVNHLREGVLLPKDIGTNACLARQGTQRYLRRFLVHRCFVEVSFAEVIYAPVRDRIQHHGIMFSGLAAYPEERLSPVSLPKPSVTNSSYRTRHIEAEPARRARHSVPDRPYQRNPNVTGIYV